MIYAFLYRLVLLVLNFKAYLNVSEINLLQYQSNKALKEKNYTAAHQLLTKITDITYVDAPEIRFNKAMIDQYTHKEYQAMAELEKLAKLADKTVAHQAALSLSAIKLAKKDSVGALEILIPALVGSNPPESILSRYEWLKLQLPATSKRLENIENRIKFKASNSKIEISNLAIDRLQKTSEQLTKDQTLEFLENLHEADVENAKKIKKITTKKSKTNW